MMPRLLNHFTRTVLQLGLAIASLAYGRANAEDAVLLASTVPGYMPGMVVAAADRLNVPEGATATLLFQSGEVLRLRGPFDGTLAQQQPPPGSGSAALFADMFRMHGVDATVIGGTRSTNLARSVPALDEVQIDPERSGTYCVQPSTSVWISRPSNDAGSYTLRRKGSSRALAWPSGAQRAEWPADVPIEDGSRFEIATGGGTSRATVTFHDITSSGASGAAQIARGMALGCRDQFDEELKRFSRSVVGPEVWITTDRGRRPTYHAGEPIALTVMVNMDGYLYCVAASEDGGARPIFPAGAFNGAQLHASMPLLIPGRRQPIGLTATAAVSQIRCWLADRDISPELPHALLNASSAPLPEQVAGDLDALFSHISGTRIESDAVSIRTE
jgi:hypothetical protein